MLKVDIVCVGRVKNASLLNLFSVYCMRLNGFCRFSVIEIDKLKVSNKTSERSILKLEAEQILKKLDLNSFVVALCVEASSVSSQMFAKKLVQIQNLGYSKISFVIGGAFGLDESVKSKANFKLSLSKLTLPHQLARLILFEQIYRSFTIINGQPYHK